MGAGTRAGLRSDFPREGENEDEETTAIRPFGRSVGPGAGPRRPGGGAGGGDLSTATQVYIDLQGDSDSTIFHSHSTCSRAGMRNGSMVVIEFARDQGFSPCPYCWS